MKPILPCSVLVFLVPATLSSAAPPKLLPEPKVSEKAVETPLDVSRWTIGAGIVFREIEGDFHLTSPGPPPGALLGGRGDVGLMQQGSGRRIRYNDGTVGPDYGIGDGNIQDGTAYTITTSGSQFTRTGRSDGGGNPIYNLAFHTSLGTYESSTYNSSDGETGVGPYLEVRYAVFQGIHTDVNLVLGYSWVSANLGSGTGVLGTYIRRDYTYNYDYDFTASQFGGLAPGSPGLNLNGPFPFADFAYAIINPGGSYAGGIGYHSPHKDVAISQELVLKGQATVDVDLHEIVLAPELSCDLGRRMHVGLSVGPTLNFIDTDMNATAAWTNVHGGKVVKSYHFQDSSTDVELGVATQLTVTVDLTRRFYFQASGSYRYVPDVAVQAGFASANIDTTAWQSSVGFGIRL